MSSPPLLFAATGLQTTDYMVVFAYMAGLLGVGVYLSRRQKSGEEFFVGERRMPWFLVGVSMLATLMSTLTYLGLPGELLKHGVAIATGLLAVPFAFVV